MMTPYGFLLEKYRENTNTVNDCIFTMMHHVAGDLSCPEVSDDFARAPLVFVVVNRYGVIASQSLLFNRHIRPYFSKILPDGWILFYLHFQGYSTKHRTKIVNARSLNSFAAFLFQIILQLKLLNK